MSRLNLPLIVEPDELESLLRPDSMSEGDHDQ